MIVVVGLSHKTAPIEVRERLAIGAERLQAFLCALKNQGRIDEALVISTCNRVELYAATSSCDPDGALLGQDLVDGLARFTQSPTSLIDPYLFRYAGDAAVRHLFRVAASLDSLVVGEAQVLGQVKQAFEASVEAGTLGPMLQRAVESALHVAKRVRTETHVGAGTVSVSSVAVQLARQIFGDLQSRPVALLGAGTMAEAAAKFLCAAGARLLVVNRSLSRAEQVADKFDAEARTWEQLRTTLIEADVVVVSTGSSSYVLTRELISTIRKARRGRSLFIIDIAVPRNVEPQVNELDGVYLYDIDDMSKIAAETMQERLTEAQRAERIVDQEAISFEAWLESLQVTPAIVALRSQIQQILHGELNRSLSGKLKHLGEADRKALDGMMNAVLNKLTHTPTTRLKLAANSGQAGDLVQALRVLFDLEGSSEQGSCPAPQPDKVPSREPSNNNAGPVHPVAVPPEDLS